MNDLYCIQQIIITVGIRRRRGPLVWLRLIVAGFGGCSPGQEINSPLVYTKNSLHQPLFINPLEICLSIYPYLHPYGQGRTEQTNIALI